MNDSFKPFSLESFYSQRSGAPQAVPDIKRREGLPEVPTSQRGVVEPPSTPAREQAAKAELPPEVVVRIKTGDCLAWNRSFCSTCFERCPEKGSIVLAAARPVVDEDRCTGCGICIQVCPAPVLAIEVVPKKRYNQAKTKL